MTSRYSPFGRRYADLSNMRPSVLATGRLLAISAVLIAWAGSASTLLVAEDHPPLLLDLSHLKLKVPSAEVVESVCDTSGRCVHAKEQGENRLIVVTLSGFLSRPSMVSLLANDFAATPADSSFWRTSDRSVGINLNGIWTLDKGSNQEMGIVAVPFSAGGPITMKVAFRLRENTSEILVSYPALVAGRASVAVSGANETRRERKGANPGVRIAFVRRTNSYCPGSGLSCVTPKNSGEVILVIRIDGDGITPDTVHSKANPPRIMIAGRPYEAALVQTAAERQVKMDDKVVITKPWIVVVFSVPGDATNIRFQVGDHPPVPVLAPNEILDELGSTDVQ